MTILAHPITKLETGSDLLLKEANHRIANQLTLLAGLIQLEGSALAKGPETLKREEVKILLDKFKLSVLAMGKMHRQLADRPADTVNLADHLIENTASLFSALALSPRPSLRHRLDNDCVVSGEQAQFISLIVSEIVINAIKHAHPTGIPVQIQLACNRTMDGRTLIEIGDDGVGLPEDFNNQTHSGLGFTLIRLLADRMNAELRIESDSLGLSFVLLFPKLH